MSYGQRADEAMRTLFALGLIFGLVIAVFAGALVWLLA